MNFKALIEKVSLLPAKIKELPVLGSIKALFARKPRRKTGFSRKSRPAAETTSVSQTDVSKRPLFTVLEEKFLQRFPENKRRPILFGFGGIVVFFLILLISALTMRSGTPERRTAPNLAASFAIPPDELFFPSEPDTLPEFILERESRHSWSLEDIRPYWRVPGNTELWQNQIRSTIDRLMEGVP